MNLSDLGNDIASLLLGDAPPATNTREPDRSPVPDDPGTVFAEFVVSQLSGDHKVSLWGSDAPAPTGHAPTAAVDPSQGYGSGTVAASPETEFALFVGSKLGG